ncbi:MAG: heme-binding domain-containing protein [Elusimicrobia bacterium]|nr:heme-binding domain-containing protein [Elusimicrobiota bacterium]
MAAAFLIAAGLAAAAWAHEGSSHVQAARPAAARQQALVRINADYQAAVKPIFQAKCWDCHSAHTRYPFYYRVPGVRWLIERDIRQARKHLDMSQDFPFLSHAGPEKDLDALRDVVQDDEMPPLLYRLGHWRSGLREGEKKVILQWVERSLKALGGTKG